jgi:hypothetical protein
MRHTCLPAHLEAIELAPVRHGTAPLRLTIEGMLAMPPDVDVIVVAHRGVITAYPGFRDPTTGRRRPRTGEGLAFRQRRHRRGTCRTPRVATAPGRLRIR